ncbi:hypothetical protein JXI42_12500 [bacterium]|nr:hypothetical protein [bacterium]
MFSDVRCQLEKERYEAEEKKRGPFPFEIADLPLSVKILTEKTSARPWDTYVKILAYHNITLFLKSLRKKVASLLQKRHYANLKG